MVVRYETPRHWITYDLQAILPALVEARAAVLALSAMPYQRTWSEALQRLQLKREVAGTSRIEGAEFTERELDAALQETPEDLITRSQRQAAAAVATYRWIATLPGDVPVDEGLIRVIHRRLVTGCDDDHCPPGVLRGRDQNVSFGIPRHRGVEGGEACAEALRGLLAAVNGVFRAHDPLVQALALHYQIAAMHPFLDGNGRTARAVEALMLQQMGLRDRLFIAMSNYYYEEKAAYLEALSDTRAAGHDLTPFLLFGLRGIAVQCRRLLEEIRGEVAKALYRDSVTAWFGRVRPARTQALFARLHTLLVVLLEQGTVGVNALDRRTAHLYTVRNPGKAFIRDLSILAELGAIVAEWSDDGDAYAVRVNLEWPAQITETEFLRRVKELPKANLNRHFSAKDKPRSSG